MASITDGDLYYVADSEITKEGIASVHIKSADAFYARGKNQIIEEVFSIRGTIQNERDSTEEDRSIKQISFEVLFNNTTAKKPIYENYDDGNKQILMPNKSLIDGYNYSSELHTSFTVKARADLKSEGEPLLRSEAEKDFHIASIPIIVGSELCHTRHMSEADKKFLGEDWKEKGGYVILKGNDGKGLEWVIDMMESRPFNMPHVFHNIGHEKEISRLEFISKAGDGVENSFQVILKHLLNGIIYVTFNAPGYMASIDIPFYIIFYLFGMTNQREIVENIIRKDVQDEEFDYVTNTMSDILETAFTTTDPVFGNASNIFDFSELTDLMASIVYNKNKSSTPGAADNYSLYTLVKTTIVNTLDKCLFSHIGDSPDLRHKKLRFFGHLIRKLLLVELKIIPSTNRDSLSNKRIDDCGRAYAKMLKTQFNLAVVIPIKHQLIKDFKSMSFSQVSLKQSVKSAVANNDLERNLIQAITTGNKELTMYNRKILNRLASETLYRKNQLNSIATFRTIRTHTTTASAQSARSNEMRRVDGSYIGYYDIVYSAPTGDRVGLVKQQAILSSITESSSSEVMKQILREDPDILLFDDVFPTQIFYDKLTIVMVNYYPVGFCNKAHTLVAKYRELRRQQKINTTISIFWDINADEILFWCDAGRMLRPLLVVRNNTDADPRGQSFFGSKYDPYKDEGFIQDVLVTKSDILDLKYRRKTILDLQREGKIDYLSPDESENCLISKNVSNLRKHQHNALKRYTHCEIQIGVLGVLGLTCPFASHNQITRVIYQTNQVRQACGVYALNYANRMDKHTFVQHQIQEPVVQTIVNKYLYPNGLNAIVAIQAYTGFNQEDSIIYNKTSASRLMYSVMASHIFSTKIENDEIVGAPDVSLTININKEANYSKLCTLKGTGYGIIKKGTVIQKNDVLVGKYATIPKTRDGQIYKDTSVIYSHDEICVVENVSTSRNQDNDYYIKIKLIGHRLLNIGCKFSSRAGQKGEVGMGYVDNNMPFTKSGLMPDLIINPCAIPSRMTIGQLLEGLMGKLCGFLGKFTDATIFNKEISDVTKIGDLLEKFGFNRFGLEKMFCGFNGRWIDTEIFIAPTYYQLLQKFTIDDMYAVSSGPTCILTHQPLEGASKGGGLRIGEMETWVLVSHGSSHFLMEKIRDDSDGYDLYICRNCGKMPVVNEDKRIYRCQDCMAKGIEPEIFKVRSSWASKLFLQELETCNVGVALGLDKPNNYVF